MKTELLRMEDISFGDEAQSSLSGFNMALYCGEIVGVFANHAIVKNDLVGLLAGRLGADSGRLYLDYEPCPFDDPDPHRQRRVGVIRPVRSLVDDLTVAENIFVIRQGFTATIIDKRLLNRQTQKLMQEFGLTLAPELLIRQLSDVERCCLEIVKAVALGARVVVLHDLASLLSDFGIERVFQFVTRLKQRNLGFVMVDSSVTHLAKYADRVVVIKNGRNFWTFAHGELDDRLLGLCFSRQPDDDVGELPASAPATPGKEALAFDQVRCGVIKGLSFTLPQGEALCVVDQAGKAIAEIKALLSGAHAAESGEIRVGGEPFTARNAWQALDQKLAFIVENPAESMIFPDLTALENLCFAASRKTPAFWIKPAYVESCRREYGQYFADGVLASYPDRLSARDLHKLVYCRWHLFKPTLVVCVKPFSSVEKSLEEISTFFIRLLLGRGIAVLILTANAAEASFPCRILTLRPKPTHPA